MNRFITIITNTLIFAFLTLLLGFYIYIFALEDNFIFLLSIIVLIVCFIINIKVVESIIKINHNFNKIIMFIIGFSIIYVGIICFYIYYNNDAILMILSYIFKLLVVVFALYEEINFKMQKNKRTISENIMISVLLIVLMVNIFRPFIDSVILNNLSRNIKINLNYIESLLIQNLNLITLFALILPFTNLRIKKI